MNLSELTFTAGARYEAKRKGRGFLPPLFFSCQLLPGVCTPVEQKQEGT